MATINGSEGNDTLTGTVDSDSISGFGKKPLDAQLGERVRHAQELKRQIMEAVPDDASPGP